MSMRCVLFLCYKLNVTDYRKCVMYREPRGMCTKVCTRRARARHRLTFVLSARARSEKSEALYAAVSSRRLALESIQSAHSRTQLSIAFASLERCPPLTPAGRVSAPRLSQRLALESAVESTRTTHIRKQWCVAIASLERCSPLTPAGLGRMAARATAWKRTNREV